VFARKGGHLANAFIEGDEPRSGRQLFRRGKGSKAKKKTFQKWVGNLPEGKIARGRTQGRLCEKKKKEKRQNREIREKGNRQALYDDTVRGFLFRGGKENRKPKDRHE